MLMIFENDIKKNLPTFFLQKSHKIQKQQLVKEMYKIKIIPKNLILLQF